MSLEEMYLEDTKVPESDAEKFFKEIEELAKKAQEYDKKADALEEEAKRYRTLSEVIRTEQLPNIMERARVQELTLEDGSSAKVREILKSSIPEVGKDQAFHWLRDHGYGAIIKNQVSLHLGKGEDVIARQVRQFLDEIHAPYEFKESVHPQTLNAFVREQLEKGVHLPDDCFSIFKRKEVKISPKK